VGSHTFDVRATDAAGNTDASPASRTWTVTQLAPPPADTTAPDTTMTGGPSGTTTQTSASLTFSATEAGSTFACRLDGWAWAACSSPKAYSGLTVGSHRFKVRATDAAGNTDTIPAARNWSITTTSGVDMGLIGTKSIESQTDQNAAGTAEVFSMTAWRTGTARKLELYVEPGGGATTVIAGIYADAGGRPGALMGQGSRAVRNGAWNTITLPERAVTTGTRYWIGILGQGGALRFRDRAGSGSSQTSAQTSLTSLPSTWTAGTTYPDGTLSVLVSGPTR
jgi:hypothetical protein